MALSLTAALTTALAASAYLNAKFHLHHDLTALFGAAREAITHVAAAAQCDRLLTYHYFEEQALRLHPDELFLVFPHDGRQWTYKQFYDATTRVGNWLIGELGIKKGEVVAIDGGNSPEYIMLWLALDGIGAVPSFVNCNLTGRGLVHSVKLCDTRYLICDRDIKNLVEPHEKELADLNIKTLYYDPPFFANLSDNTSLPEERREHISPDSLKFLLYTSGTTGLPKATKMLAARTILTGHMISRYLRLKPGDRMYTCMPLFHGAPHGLCVLPTIHAGSTVVLGRKFSHRTFWPEVRESKANIMQYVGELCRYLLNGPPSPLDKQHNLRMAWGNGMRPDVWEPFRERFRIPVINELYAATDGMGAMFNENRGEFTRHAIGLRGLVWDLVRGRSEVIVRFDTDTEEIVCGEDGFAIRCKINEPGEVIHMLDPAAPDEAFPGYYGNRAAGEKRKIRDVFKKGDLWFRSGDMMRRDADGRVYFVDRLGDTFRWKSENVSTNEVSDVLGAFPQIAEVNVYGVSVPHADGRCGCAAFVMAEGVEASQFDFDALAKYVLGSLPRYAVPVFLRLAKELSYTGTLKLQKGRLKSEGVDLEKLGSEDRVFWMPADGRTYVPFRRGHWEALKEGRVRL